MLTPDETAALKAIEDAITAGTDELAPEGSGWVVGEWALVLAWSNVETGDHQLSRLAAPHMLKHHMTGLLHEGIKDDWGSDADD